jgi:hypothetical protein
MLILTAACVSLLGSPSQVTAENIVAYFDGGGSDATPVTNVVDAYTGMVGDGWSSEWTRMTSRGGNPTVQVLNSSELTTGSGNYLDIVSPADSDGETRASVCRGYNDGATIDITKPIQYKMTVRINEDTTSSSATFDHWDRDHYQIVEYTRSDSSTSGSRYGWGIVAHGMAENARDGETVDQAEWRFADTSNYAAFSEYGLTQSSFPLDGGTGIYAVQGGVYEMTVQVNPDLGTGHGNWSASIEVLDDPYGYNAAKGGVTYYSRSNMTWRKSSDLPGGWLNFYTWTKSVDDTRAWSIDNIEISQIPEPSTMVLLLIGMLGASSIRRRRSR